MEIGGVNNSMAVLLSDLYLQLQPRAPANIGQATLVSVKAGRAYLANMTFVGDWNACRGFDVHSNTTGYISGAAPSRRPTLTAWW